MTVHAEAAVLGAALASDRAADLLLDLVAPDAITNHAHRIVYAAVSELRGRGDTADLASVTGHLARTGRLEEAGEAAGLYDLLAAAPPGRVEQWCRQITAQNRRRRLGSLIERWRVEVDEVDDVDQLADDAVSELLDLSTSGASGTVDPARLLDAFEVRLTSGTPLAGWKMPWRPTEFFRLPDDGLTVWTGLPGSGKSTMLDAAIVEWLKGHDDMRVAFFSPEMSPADNHLHELTRTALGRDPHRDPDAARDAARWLTGRVWWIDDDRHTSAGAVLAQARRLVRDQGVRLLVIDPYNNLEPDGPGPSDRQDLQIQALLRRLRRFARSHQVAVVVVAHPRRTEKVAGTDAVYRIPTAGDISGGQEWWNHADAIVSVWRNQSGEERHRYGEPWDVTFTASKVRFGKWGRTGKGELTFDETSRQYRPRPGRSPV